jgi:hypothetical protein
MQLDQLSGAEPNRATDFQVNRRTFLCGAGAVPLLGKTPTQPLPSYRIVTRFKRSAQPGMPGPYRGQVVRVHSNASIDNRSGAVNQKVVAKMLQSGMRALTGDAREEDCWARFVSPQDTVGIKVNCSGAPHIMSSPELVAVIVKNVTSIGVPPERIWIYERFEDQLNMVGYDRYVAPGVQIWAAEGKLRKSLLGYDPDTYV